MRIAGYTFKADNYCPDCILSQLPELDLASSYTVLLSTEEALDLESMALGVDRYNEATYDSSEFPKVIFFAESETCGQCGREL